VGKLLIFTSSAKHFIVVSDQQQICLAITIYTGEFRRASRN